MTNKSKKSTEQEKGKEEVYFNVFDRNAVSISYSDGLQNFSVNLCSNEFPINHLIQGCLNIKEAMMDKNQKDKPERRLNFIG